MQRLGERARGGIVKGTLVAFTVAALMAGALAGEADAARKGTKPAKVAICHLGVDEATGAETLTYQVVSRASLKAHRQHGDIVGGAAADGTAVTIASQDDCTTLQAALAPVAEPAPVA